MVRRSGSNSQGSPPATLESKRTVILRPDVPVGADLATCVVPPNPVVRQNQEYSGTAANDIPTIPATTPPQIKATSRSRRDVGGNSRFFCVSIGDLASHSGLTSTPGPLTSVTM